MLDKTRKLLELRTSRLVDSLFVGNYKTKLKGRGIEFVDYKEYDFSDDVKNIDFLRSQKEGKTLVKLYEEERDLSLYFVINLSDTFFSDIFGYKKIDLVYEILYIIGFSAIKQGDKIGAYYYNLHEKLFKVAKKGKNNFVNIIQELEKIENNYYINQKKDFNFFIKNFFSIIIKKNNKFLNNNIVDGLKYFNTLKIKNSLVFFITDDTNFDEKDIKILGLKNDLIFCNIFNSFENTLDSKGLVHLNNESQNIILDLENEEKIKQYVDLRDRKIFEIRKKITKNGGKYILLDEKKNVYKELSKIFRK